MEKTASDTVFVPGTMCKKHLVRYQTRDGGGGYTVEFCPKCEDEQNPGRSDLLAALKAGGVR